MGPCARWSCGGNAWAARDGRARRGLARNGHPQTAPRQGRRPCAAGGGAQARSPFSPAQGRARGRSRQRGGHRPGGDRSRVCSAGSNVLSGTVAREASEVELQGRSAAKAMHSGFGLPSEAADEAGVVLAQCVHARGPRSGSRHRPLPRRDAAARPASLPQEDLRLAWLARPHATVTRRSDPRPLHFRSGHSRRGPKNDRPLRDASASRSDAGVAPLAQLPRAPDEEEVAAGARSAPAPHSVEM
jgi:hypothetical protein